MCGGRTERGAHVETVATLVCETDNRYDSNAVRVDVDGVQVAHLSRADAARYRPVLLHTERRYGPCLFQCDATIVGGWDGGDGDRGHFGIKLQLAGPRCCLPQLN